MDQQPEHPVGFLTIQGMRPFATEDFYKRTDLPPNMPRWMYGRDSLFDEFCHLSPDRHVIVNRSAYHMICNYWNSFKSARIADRHWMHKGFLGTIGHTHVFTEAFLSDFELWVDTATTQGRASFVIVPPVFQQPFTPKYLIPNHDLHQAGSAGPDD